MDIPEGVSDDRTHQMMNIAGVNNPGLSGIE
jgi:hypothetical protein